jgi:hypothetical protein
MRKRKFMGSIDRKKYARKALQRSDSDTANSGTRADVPVREGIA